MVESQPSKLLVAGSIPVSRSSSCRQVDEPAASLDVGTRIFHQKFGYGTIVASEAGKLKIDFEKAGIKKVMKSFVQRA